MSTTVKFYRDETERRVAGHFDRLRGGLFGIVELARMEPHLERDAKELIRTVTYKAQREMIETWRSQAE